MPRIKPSVVSPSEVKVIRNGDTAVINYSDPAMGAGMNIKIGPELAMMTDFEVVEIHNDMIRDMLEYREDHP